MRNANKTKGLQVPRKNSIYETHKVPSDINNVTGFDLGWLVGIYEGEGSFTLHNKRYPVVALVSTDEDTIDKAIELLGVGSKYYSRSKQRIKQGWTPTYVYHIRRRAALDLILMLYPYMSERRQMQMDAVLLPFLEILND